MAFPVEEKYIRKAETESDVKFPSSYINKLIIENGGELDTEDNLWIFFPVFDDSDRKRILRTANHIIRENKSAKEWENFPENGLAIAENGSGDYLIYLIEDNKEIRDDIYFWNHETGELEKVADSIKELFEE